MHGPEPPRPLPTAWADAVRGSVRLMFPLASLGVLAALLYGAQGRDVLRTLVGMAADGRTGNQIGGLVFLMAACTLLSASLWYSARWLLTAQMVALPLPPIGTVQTWLPRALGAAAPGFVALGLLGLRAGDLAVEGDEATTATWWALWFALLALALLVFYAARGALIVRMRMGDPAGGRRLAGSGASVPAQIGVAEPMPAVTRLVIVWSIAVSMTLALLFVLFPVSLPRMVGAASAAALALASINLFGSFVLTYAPLRQALPPMWVWAIGAAGLLVAPFNDNHVVRPARDAAAPARADDTLAALVARAQRDEPLVFVASEGGGIRAAFWTAAVLDALTREVPELRPRLALLSGVSGGSLGLAAWLATHRGDWCPSPPSTPSPTVGLRSDAPPPLAATTALSADFVAPAITGLFFGDLLQRFIPWPIDALDRARTIESSWEQAFAHLPGRPFEHRLDTLYADCPGLPELVLNATRVETGERVALSRLPFATAPGAPLLVNTFDALAPGSAARQQALSGLVHHSARFPLVSPAGTVPVVQPASGVPPRFRLVDGGYFDNSGVQTVLDLITSLRQLTHQPRLRVLLLTVRNAREPFDHQPEHPQGSARKFPESGSIVSTLLAVRRSHAVSARGMAQRLLTDDLIDLEVPAAAGEAPLGWALSDRARSRLLDGAGEVARQVAPMVRARLSAAAPAERQP
ncbi:MAG: hypothetical protein U1F56_10995 [Rubrivivax sp.]